MFFMDEELMLNDNDRKLLVFCKGKPKSISEVSGALCIASKNVSVRLDKLKKAKLIDVKVGGAGRKTRIKTREDKKMDDYTIKILKALKKEGGEMNLDDFHKLNPFDLTSEDSYDEFYSTLNVQYSDLVEHIIRISKKGKEFLLKAWILNKQKKKK